MCNVSYPQKQKYPTYCTGGISTQERSGASGWEQSVKRLTLGLGSVRDLEVMRSSPTLGSVLGMDPA